MFVFHPYSKLKKRAWKPRRSHQSWNVFMLPVCFCLFKRNMLSGRFHLKSRTRGIPKQWAIQVNAMPNVVQLTWSDENLCFLHSMAMLIKLIKSVAYSSQGSHTGQLDFCNWLADRSTTAMLITYNYFTCFGRSIDSLWDWRITVSKNVVWFMNALC